ncbi:MAG: hypothetical protein FJZ56_02175 [Chlamydiae bacterium]|nr:hypothetical protein [Chlamydiota bacterium]
MTHSPLFLQFFTVAGFIGALFGWGWIMKGLINEMAKWNTLKSWQRLSYCAIFLLLLFLALGVLFKFDARFTKVFGI